MARVGFLGLLAIVFLTHPILTVGTTYGKRGQSAMRAPCAAPSGVVCASVSVPGCRPARHSGRARHAIPRASSVEVADTVASVQTQHVVCVSFDAIVDATSEMALVGFEAARRFWPGEIPGEADDYADVFAMLAPCLDESSSFEAALMVRVMAEENLAARTRFRLELRARKQARLRMEKEENAELERATTAKRRERLAALDAERAEALARRRKEYAEETERLRAGRRTRPLNLREVVAGWDEIKLHASVKFGNRVETNVGWEGRTVAPAGLQAMVDDVREAFAAGTMRLSADDTNPDDGDEEEEERETETRRDVRRVSGAATSQSPPPPPPPPRSAETVETVSPKRRWLDSHALHHGAGAFIETCRARGHEVVVLGGPGRSAEQCREVLSHLGVRVAERCRTRDAGGARLFSEAPSSDGPSGACRVVGAEYGASRGLAVAAMMHAHEQPWQRWHLVDASLAELSRVASSGLEETSAFTSQFAAWTPALHADKVRAELRDGVKFVDHHGLFELVGADAPPSVMDAAGDA